MHTLDMTGQIFPIGFSLHFMGKSEKKVPLPNPPSGVDQ